MTGVITFGAGPSDTITLLGGGSQAVPVGRQTANPIIVRALAPDGITPVAGASIFFTSVPPAALAVCGGASSCTVLTNQSGLASSYATVLSPTVTTINVQLAPASYNPPQQVQATVFGTSSALDIGLVPQAVWIAQGASLSVPLMARVLSNGSPLTGPTVDFHVLKGSGLLSAVSAAANASGYAATILQVSAIAGDVQVSACVKNQPVDSPCLSFYATAVPNSALQLQPVAGNPQIVPAGQSFAPVVFQVTDSTGIDPVFGASVSFQSVVGRLPANLPAIWMGDTSITGNPMPVILASSQVSVQSDVSGMVSFQPSVMGVQGPVVVLGSASAGISSLPFTLESVSAASGSAPQVVRGPARSNLRRGPGAH